MGLKVGSIVTGLMVVIVCTSCDKFGSKETKFKLLSSKQTGIDFSNALNETHEMNIISYPDFYSGGGVSIGDIDNDGLPDVFFTGNQVPARLYKNKGNLKFDDITVSAKLDRMGRGWYTGTCMVDINADGYLDIYVSKSGMEAPEDRANLLFINNQDGTFTEKAKEFGLDNQGYGVNAVFFDYDKDGDLDVYIANQVSTRLNSGHATQLRNVSDPYAGDKLYENVNGYFTDVTKKAGLYSSKVGFAHGAAVGDINNDGWEDFFVSNDFFEYDYLYLNNGDKTFRQVIKEATKHISHFSMGNDMADFDNDGLLDIMVLDMVPEDNRRKYENAGGNNERKFQVMVQQGLLHQYMFNVLHLNNGNETFSEIGMVAGISRTDWSWAPIFADFDNDGYKDVYVTNGLRKDIRNIDWGKSYKNMSQLAGSSTEFEPSQWEILLKSMPSEKIANYMFRNNGDLTFEKVAEDWGLNYTSWSNGAAFGDLDHDGDLDIIINNVDEEAFVFENKVKHANFLRFKFSGPEYNPMGLGTKVKIYHGGKFQYQQHYVSRGYRSSMEPIMHFGLGGDTLVSKIEIQWIDGKTMVLRDKRTNQIIDLNYEDATDGAKGEKHPFRPYFEDITQRIGIQVSHKENDMVDFMNEPMLPYKLSTLGPAFDVADVNGDGLDDFFLGGSFRYEAQLLIQNDSGAFTSVLKDVWKADRHYEDVGATFFDIDNDGDQDLFLVSGGTENTLENKMLKDRLYINDGKGNFSKSQELLPEYYSSGSVGRAADFDHDGDLDLFIAGRVIPRSYPLPADSYLLENRGGKFFDATNHIAPELTKLGMVTDAIWSDYNLDGDLDLIVVGEWMEVTIFENREGTFSKIENLNNGLEKLSGWWWSIAAHDMDKDGDDDYVLGNMGLNYKFKPTKNGPLEMFADDFDGDGKMDIAFGHYQNGKLYPFYNRSKAIQQNNDIGQHARTNSEYASMDVYEIYGKEIEEKSYRKRINTLKSGYLENLGNGKFNFKPFDNYAQISTVNSILVEDVDADGNLDLILGGNLYNMEAETIRNDASIGVWMKGNGLGIFESQRYQTSGLFLDGDIRGIKTMNTESGAKIICAKNNDSIQIIDLKR